MGAMSRQKGKRGEREAAAEIERLFRCEARRGVQFRGGPESPDVVHGIEGLHLEVKRTESLRVWDAIEQAVADAGEDNLPAVLHRKNGKDWLFIARLEDMPEIAVKLFGTLAANPK